MGCGGCPGASDIEPRLLEDVAEAKELLSAVAPTEPAYPLLQRLVAAFEATCHWRYRRAEEAWETECGQVLRVNGVTEPGLVCCCPYCGRRARKPTVLPQASLGERPQPIRSTGST